MQEPKRSSLDIFSRPSFHQCHDVTILEDGERSNPVVLGWGKEREGKASIGKRLIEGAVDVEFGKERLEDVAIEGRTGGEQDLTVRGPRNVFKPPPVSWIGNPPIESLIVPLGSSSAIVPELPNSSKRPHCRQRPERLAPLVNAA